MHAFLVAVVSFIVLIGIMVVVHEFGHFIVAKLCGVRVEAFSIGFGPRLFGIKIGETDYKVCALPLGGYVKMTGETPDHIADSEYDAKQGPAADPKAFTSHPRWQRMLIGLAGPMANFVFAFVLMTIYFHWVNEIPDIKTVRFEWITPGSVADKAGIKPGDVIVQLGTLSHPNWQMVSEGIESYAGQTVPLTVDRNEQDVSLSLPVPADAAKSSFDLQTDTGIYLQMYSDPLSIEGIIKDSAAEQAGLQAGDKITAVDGFNFHTVDPLLNYMKVGQGKPITLSVVRNGVALGPITAHPKQDKNDWFLGFRPQQPSEPTMYSEPKPLMPAIALSSRICVESSGAIVGVLKKLFTHQASVTQLSGPVGIAAVAGKVAETRHWGPKFSLASSISLNLGVLNLLPFPILDGGLILFLLIESVIRRDISMAIKERIYQVAFVIVILFFAFIVVNDVMKLHLFGH